MSVIVEVLANAESSSTSVADGDVIEVIQGSRTASFEVQETIMVEVDLYRGPQGTPGTVVTWSDPAPSTTPRLWVRMYEDGSMAFLVEDGVY